MTDTGPNNGPNSRFDFKSLAGLTLTDPARAADRILSMQISRDGLWTGFALVVTMNTILGQWSAHTMAPEAGFDITLPLFAACMALANAVVITAAGRMLGGTGTFTQVLSVFLWLQFLQALAQGAILIVSMAVPTAEMPLLMGMLLYSLYLSIHLIKVVHGFDNTGKSVGTLLMSVVLAMVILTIVLSLFGGCFPAELSNV